MASPHPPYPHPGPSSYFHPPPPPQLPYNAPGPAPYYQYQVPPMNGHSSMHQPASPRLNGTGRGRFNQLHRGGVPNYPHYQAMPHMHPPPPPPPMQSPPTSPQVPYTHPQKYSPHISQVPYSPPYPQLNGPYPPAWSTQTLSPLPKQLSMPPPVFLPQPQPQPQAVQETQKVQAVQDEQTVQEPVASSADTSQSVSSPPRPSPSSPQLDSVQFEVDSESLSSSQSEPPKPMADTLSWVVWSRRPQDPSRAPGIIISSRAYPPEHILRDAVDLPSPPVSPQLRSLKLPLQQLALLEGTTSAAHEETEESPEPAHVASSSATETTPASLTPADTPMPGSPLSSLTSVSITGASPSGVEKSLTPAEPQSKVVTAPSEMVQAEAVSTPTSETASAKAPADAAPPASPAAPAPSAKHAPLTKSWASLLQSSHSAASSSKSRLPVSSVIGFSIPAGSTSSSPTAPGAHSHRNDLLNVLNSLPSASNIPLKITPRGLVNTGNMCFANAVLQVLVYCPPFHKLFKDLSKYLPGPVAGSQKQATPLLDATIQFMKEFAPPSVGDASSKGKEREDDDFYEPESFIPSYVYDAMKEKKRFSSMITGHQEDAEEFLGFFLDTLEEELLSLVAPPSSKARATEEHEGGPPHDDGWYEVGKRNKLVSTRTIKSTDSPITRIFGGKFRSTLRAPHQRDSVIVEDWRSLRLDIQRDQVNSITDALQHISHPQAVQISSPTRPGVVIDASQQALIESLPPVLILHLKRFHYDTNVGDVVKIGKQIAFGPDLEIGPDLIAPTRRTTHPIKYQLFGVLYHHGQSAHGGHYTLDVLHPNRDLSDRPRQAWIRIDDELVSDVRPEDVFNGMDRDDRCAYLLFYRRVGGWGPART
ncbi:hypothetical protein BKA93DRAFT_919454 [Sparassis latifolia]